MSRCIVMLSVCVLLPSMLLAGQVLDDYPPLQAPKPLIPLEQIEGPLPDDYVIAELDGQPIPLSELLESGGYAARLQQLKEEVTADQFRSVQVQLLERDLIRYLQNRLLVREFRRGLNEQQKEIVDRRLNEIWNGELEKLKSQYEVDSIESLEARVAEEGRRSLAGQRQSFEHRIMVQQYVRSQIGEIQDREQAEKAVENLQKSLLRAADVRSVVNISRE